MVRLRSTTGSATGAPGRSMCPEYPDLVDFLVRKLERSRAADIYAHTLFCERCLERMESIRQIFDETGPNTIKELRESKSALPAILRNTIDRVLSASATPKTRTSSIRKASPESWVAKILDHVLGAGLLPALAPATAASRGSALEVPLDVRRIAKSGVPGAVIRHKVIVPPTLEEDGTVFLTLELTGKPSALEGAHCVLIVESRPPRKRTSTYSTAATKVRKGRVRFAGARVTPPITGAIRSAWVFIGKP